MSFIDSVIGIFRRVAESGKDILDINHVRLQRAKKPLVIFLVKIGLIGQNKREKQQLRESKIMLFMI
jgi:hypothetical protein